MICKVCGKELPYGVRFCTGCGSSVSDQPAAPVQPAVIVIEAPQKRSSAMADWSFALAVLSLLSMSVPLVFTVMAFVPLVHYWSGVFGLFIGPLFWAGGMLMSLVSLVLGIIALIKAKKGGHSISFAVWGVVLSALNLIVALLLPFAVLFSLLLLYPLMYVDYAAVWAGLVVVILLMYATGMIFI